MPRKKAIKKAEAAAAAAALITPLIRTETDYFKTLRRQVKGNLRGFNVEWRDPKKAFLLWCVFAVKSKKDDQILAGMLSNHLESKGKVVDGGCYFIFGLWKSLVESCRGAPFPRLNF